MQQNPSKLNIKNNAPPRQTLQLLEMHCPAHGLKVKYFCLEPECTGKRRLSCDECVGQTHRSHKMLLVKDLHAKLKTLHSIITQNSITDDVDLLQQKIVQNTKYLLQTVSYQLEAIENMLLETIEKHGIIKNPEVNRNFELINPESLLTENSPQAAAFYDKAFTCVSERQFLQEHFTLRQLVPEVQLEVQSNMQKVDTILTEAVLNLQSTFQLQQRGRFFNNNYCAESLSKSLIVQNISSLNNSSFIMGQQQQLKNQQQQSQSNSKINPSDSQKGQFQGVLDYKLYGHTKAVNEILQLDDNKHVLSCSEDGSLRVWDLSTNSSKECITIMENERHRDGFWCVCRWDEDVVVSGGIDGQIAFWDWKKGILLHDLQVAHQGTVRHLIKISDSQLLSCGSDRTMFLWDQLEYITNSSLLPDDNGDDNTGGDSDEDYGKNQYGGKLKSKQQQQNILQQQQNQQLQQKPIFVKQNQKNRAVVAKSFFHQKDVNSMLLMPIGVVLTFGEDQCVKMWDLDQGKCIQTLETDYILVESVFLSLNNVAVSTSNGKILIMELPDMQINRILNGHTAGFWIYGLITIGSGLILSCSTSEDPNVILWQWRNSFIVKTFQSRAQRILCASQIGCRNIATGDMDGTIQIWK